MDIDRISKIEKIARVTHAAMAEYKRLFGKEEDASKDLIAWDDLPPETQKMIKDGVSKQILGDIVSPRESHEQWMKNMQADGYVYGSVLDRQAKTHPCLVPYEELAVFDRTKDWIFFNIVNATSRNI